jgi:hypothetical protein
MRIYGFWLSVIFICTLRSEEKGVWIQDWQTLAESGYSENKAPPEGVINGRLHYSVTAEARIIALSELEESSGISFLVQTKTEEMR